ncbi:MAG: hypothetical protein ACRDRG_05980 [Pseudonocardiaceae bacterium]
MISSAKFDPVLAEHRARNQSSALVGLIHPELPRLAGHGLHGAPADGRSRAFVGGRLRTSDTAAALDGYVR